MTKPSVARKRDMEEGTTIKVERAWLVGLLSTAQRVVDTIDRVDTTTNSSIAAKSNIYALLGYVSSADGILQCSLKSPKKKR